MKIVLISVVRDENVDDDDDVAGIDSDGLLLEQIGNETLSEVLDRALDHVRMNLLL
jgi:hypothetical protein